MKWSFWKSKLMKPKLGLTKYERIWTNMREYELIWMNMNEYELIWTNMNEYNMMWNLTFALIQLASWKITFETSSFQALIVHNEMWYQLKMLI